MRRCRTFRITTLGCRANHAETRELESILLSRGLEPACGSIAADLEVIHTCSVTNAAAAKSRNALRRAIRRQQTGMQQTQNLVSNGENHHGRAGVAGPAPATSFGGTMPEVIVTGCYASTNTAEAAGITGQSGNVITQSAEEADPSTLTQRFAARVDRWLGATASESSDDANPSIRHSPSQSSINHRSDAPTADAPDQPSNAPVIHPLPVIPPRSDAGSHIRAELRIQDGCDAHCTFCIIPKIRRNLRSKRITDAVDEARMLVDQGHKEIVLTGIFIGAYGHETALRRRQANRSAHPLADLVDAIAQVPGLQRLRISSMEPGDVDESLLDAMVANAPIVVPHLHLPLQSGSDRILKRMNRQYCVGDYLDMIDMVNDSLTIDGLPPAITTDIICGFPGETEDDFQQTVDIARRVGYLHMHVFPFSPKKGTAAARWKDQYVAADEKKRRVRTLIDLEEDPVNGFAVDFNRRLEGREVRVILEQPDKDNPALMTGRCDHYSLVKVETDKPRGSIVTVRIDNAHPNHLTGSVIDQPVALPVADAVL